MPPQTQPIPLPTTRGKDAREYLESKGIVAVTPSIRSSDHKYEEFRYYLTRRLGLSKAYDYAEPLSLGQWAHLCLELFDEPHAESRYQLELHHAKEEIKDLPTTLTFTASDKQRAIEQLDHDAALAKCMWEASLDVRIGTDGTTLRRWLMKRHWQKLGNELICHYYHPKYPKTPLTVQLDQLWYHPTQNALYILDLKTTSLEANVRAAQCPVDFQTWHYMFVVQWMLDHGMLQQKYDLPHDVRLGGMAHIILQKTKLRPSNEDRPYEWVDRTLTRKSKQGEKGDVIREKKYTGDTPLWENYLQRITEWYTATGQFQHLAEGRKESPTVNISYTFAETLDEDVEHEYHSIVSHIYSMATRTPEPVLFSRTSDGILGRNWSVSQYAPFYLMPVSQWPDIIRRQGFIQQYRDDPNAIPSESAIEGV